MNWLIVLPLFLFVASFAILVAQTHGVVLGRQLPIQPVLGILVGVVTGGCVVALNHDVVPDQVEAALVAVLATSAAASVALVSVELTRR